LTTDIANLNSLDTMKTPTKNSLSRTVLLTAFLLFTQGLCCLGAGSTSENQAAAQNTQPPSVKIQAGRLVCGDCWLEEQNGIPVLHLKGKPYDMGYQQGLLAKHKSPDRPLNPAEAFGLDDQAQAQIRQLAERFEPFIPPDLAEQMRGIADALRVPYEDVLFTNVFVDAMFAMSCLNFAVCDTATPDGKVIHAASLEHGNILTNRRITQDGRWVTLAVYQPDKGHDFAVVIPDLTVVYGFFGINENKLTAGVTALPAKDTTLDGIPTWMLLRKVLQHAATIPEARRLVRQTQRTWGASITFTDGKTNKAASIEFSSTRSANRTAQSGFLLETNRMADKSLYNEVEKGVLSETYESWMDAREKRFAQLLEANAGRIDVTKAVELLRDTFDLTSGENSLAIPAFANEGNLNSVVFKPAELNLWVAHHSVPMVFGEFVGFNLTALLSGRQSDVEPPLIPADTRLQSDWFDTEMKRLGQLAQTGGYNASRK